MSSDIDVAGLVLSNSRSAGTDRTSTSNTSTILKPRTLGKIRVQGHRSNPEKRVVKKEEFNVQGESFSANEPIPEPKKAIVRLSSSEIPKLPQVKQRRNSLESNKKLEDALKREKSLQLKIETLEIEVSTLTNKLSNKSKTIKDQEQVITEHIELESKYKQLWEDEKESHSETKSNYQALQEKHNIMESELNQSIMKLKSTLDKVKSECEEKISLLKKEHEEILNDKEKRIENLKKQIAGTLGNKSHERQSQIDDLSKELQKVGEELETLRRRNKNCQQCEKYRQNLREHEEKIRNLVEYCSKFKGKLGEQEELLNILTKVGYMNKLPQKR